MIEDKWQKMDEFFMQRCLDLAANGHGHVAPNPMVGAVITYDGKAIGEGYHRQYGGPHAEVNAINAVRDADVLKKSTLYVNLEPCAHQGKTPPCSDLIIEKKIPRVVIGTTDSNSLVAGKGIEKLRKAGVEVKLNILPSQCLELNRRFFTFHEKKRPFIILKWAQTKDGFLDVVRTPKDPIGVNWISNPLSQMLVHKWRAEEQAIFAGSNTVLFDNPQLTVRHWKGNNPLRIILDRELRIPDSARVLDNSAPTLCFNSKVSKQEGQLEYSKLKNRETILTEVFQDLYSRNIISLIVEGGRHLLNLLIDNDLYDEARVFTGDKFFGKGIPAPQLPEGPAFVEEVLNDTLSVYRKKETR